MGGVSGLSILVFPSVFVVSTCLPQPVRVAIMRSSGPCGWQILIWRRSSSPKDRYTNNRGRPFPALGVAMPDSVSSATARVRLARLRLFSAPGPPRRHCARLAVSDRVRWPLAGVVLPALNGTGMGCAAPDNLPLHYDTWPAAVGVGYCVLGRGLSRLYGTLAYAHEPFGWLAFSCTRTHCGCRFDTFTVSLPGHWSGPGASPTCAEGAGGNSRLGRAGRQRSRLVAVAGA